MIPNRLMPRWLKTVVVNDEEKAPIEVSGGDREGERKRIVDDVSKSLTDGIKTGAGIRFRDESGGCSAYWPDGVRHIGDASPICGIHVEQEKAYPDTVCLGWVGERECPKR